MSDKLITRVLLHSTVAAISLPTLILKISCILDPKPIQLKCYIKCTCTGYVLLQILEISIYFVVFNYFLAANKNLNTKIKHVPTNKTRTLVGVLVIPSNDSYEVKECIFHAKNTTLSPKNLFFSYERYWLPSLTFASPVLTITYKGSILAPLHKALCPRLKLLALMQSAPIEIGELNLRPLEITSGNKAICHLASLFTSKKPSKLILVTAT